MAQSNHKVKISESEWKVMKVIWESGTVSSAEVVRRLKPVTGWKDNTIYTLINRLAKKEMLRIDKTVSPNLCIPLVSQRRYQREERKSFLQRVYDGSLSLMLANIVEEGSLSSEEIDDLKKILDQNGRGGKKEGPCGH
jgi:BlaI family penicillinase repressor